MRVESKDHTDNISHLEQRIKSLRGGSHHHRAHPIHSTLSVWTVASELIAGLVVGLLLGAYLDHIFHTLPIFLIFCTIFGSYGGLYNLYKTTIRTRAEHAKQNEQQQKHSAQNTK